MTLSIQDIFEKVSRHLLTQNKKSISSNNHCKYRHGEYSCAIGCLIPDEIYDQYKERIEYKSFNTNFLFENNLTDRTTLMFIEIFNKCNLLNPNDQYELTRLKLCFMKDLQQIHDNVDVLNWRKNLIKLGLKYSLNYDFLQEFNV